MGKDLSFKGHFNPPLHPENAALEPVALHETEGLTFHTAKQKAEPAQAKGTETTPQEQPPRPPAPVGNISVTNWGFSGGISFD